MESPSVQRMADTSSENIANMPSSPFQTEVEAPHIPSKYRRYTVMDGETVLDIFETPMQSPVKPSSETPLSTFHDKENLPDFMAHDVKTWVSRPSTPQTHEDMLVDCGSARHGQSTSSAASAISQSSRVSPRKTASTPRRSPLKPVERAPPSSRPESRDSFTDAQSYRGMSSFRQVSQSHDNDNLDDTCVSTFSAIPDMTLFAKLGQSPTKRGEMLRTPGKAVDATPRTSRKRPSPSRSPSPTPRRQKSDAPKDGTTSFLIDFTQQMDNVTSYRTASPGKSGTESNLLQYIHNQRSPNKNKSTYSTPNKSNNLLNLLDFELPPAPTPRSVPTITVRELESLKSSYLSQISGLKATLSGREAEVESLKRAIADAERRAGEAQESLRNEKCKKEYIEQEKNDWEKRAQEIEHRLKSVKEEVLKGEAEKEEMQRKVLEYERRAEDAEERAVKAEERYAEALVARTSASEGDANQVEEQVQRLVAAQIDSKIEAVSRELHAVYKEKHERKVATLKKSYEARGEKKCAELQTRLAEVEKQNEELQAAKDATFSGPVDQSMSAAAEAELKAQLEEQRAALARLEEEMSTSREQQAQLARELEQERIEKGDLVAAVDEMLALQSEQGPPQGAMSVVEDFRKSISRSTGLKTPGGESRIGKGGLGAGRGLPPPTAGKSKMLANIERMGRAGGLNGSHG